jgi:hypothetical protein
MPFIGKKEESHMNTGYIPGAKKGHLCIIGATLIFSLQTAASAQDIKADHTTLEVEGLSQEALDNARALRMSLDHASVGENIRDGIRALVATSKERYAYPNWNWRSRGNPGWKEKIDQFTQWVDDNSSKYDVFMMKFCYVDQDADFDYYRDKMLALEAKYTTKQFVWWTMPIKTTTDSKRNAFNSAVRKYCAANNKSLYDIAAIESHNAAGEPVSSDGEVLDKAWASDSGHLNDDGALRAAKAIWLLMAKLSGAPTPPATDNTSTAQEKPAAGSSTSETDSTSTTQVKPAASSSTPRSTSETKSTASKESSGSCTITEGPTRANAALWMIALGFAAAFGYYRRRICGLR